MKTDIQDNTLFNSFLALLNQERQDGSYPVIPVKESCPHKVGCSTEGIPFLSPPLIMSGRAILNWSYSM